MKNLGFGCMRLPLLSEKNSDIDLEQFKKMVDIYLEKGFTYFDTAYRYHEGQSEIAVREGLVKRYPRDAFTITSKMPLAIVEKKEDLETIFADQLEKIGIDHFDYYLLHNINDTTYDTAKNTEAFTFLSGLKEKGLTKHIGFSFHGTPEMLDEILSNHPEIEFVQIQLNYLDWTSANVQSGKCYEVIRKYNKNVLVMEPIKGGKLAKVPAEVEKMFKDYDPNASVASWAVRFAASLPGVYMVLSGMSNLEQLEDNTTYMEDFKPLNDEEKAIVEKAAEIITAQNAIPCTACRYCVEGCPMQIAIPEYFNLYNDDKKKNAYDQVVARGNGKASDCIKCGACEVACPQHLKIRDYLADLIVPKFEA